MERKRKYYTREERERLVAEYRAGTTDVATFAADRRIRPATLRNWLHRHPPVDGATGQAQRVQFVAIDVGHPGDGSDVEVVIGEVTVRVPSRVGAGFVAEFVSRLAKKPC